MKIHLAFSVPGLTPGSNVTGHVCGREHGQNDGDNNVTIDRKKVTCLVCLKIIADKKNWRHRKYIGS